jgi:hypothetical protein
MYQSIFEPEVTGDGSLWDGSLLQPLPASANCAVAEPYACRLPDPSSSLSLTHVGSISPDACTCLYPRRRIRSPAAVAFAATRPPDAWLRIASARRPVKRARLFAHPRAAPNRVPDAQLWIASAHLPNADDASSCISITAGMKQVVAATTRTT